MSKAKLILLDLANRFPMDLVGDQPHHHCHFRHCRHAGLGCREEGDEG